MSWSVLRAEDYASVPSRPGVYVVLRPTVGDPAFVHPSPAYWRNGKDPTAPEAFLRAHWVADASVVYIGKADFRTRRTRVEALRRRLDEYGTFGAGARANHSGGRLVWQLASADELLVAWHVVAWQEAAGDYERRLLTHFAALHGGRLPFANLRR